MVFQFILAGILLLVVIVYLAVVYWPITLTIIGVIAFLWWWSSRRKRHNSDEQYEYDKQYEDKQYEDKQYEDKQPEEPNYEKYFEILHLNQDATIQEVKEQYRKFVQMYHPDKTSIGKKQSEEKFILVTRAKDVLEEKLRLRTEH